MQALPNNVAFFDRVVLEIERRKFTSLLVIQINIENRDICVANNIIIINYLALEVRGTQVLFSISLQQTLQTTRLVGFRVILSC